jgi:hypothetical protein
MRAPAHKRAHLKRVQLTQELIQRSGLCAVQGARQGCVEEGEAGEMAPPKKDRVVEALSD